jgi:sporulation protein YlmC with PRC-barrel domain
MYNFLGLKNRPILSKDDLCIIGLVKDCFSVENNCQIAYFLCINNDQDFLVPFDNFTAINDALVLDNCIEIRHVQDVDFTTLKSLMAKDVYLDNGQYVGKATDLSFDHNGKILQVFAGDNTFKPSDIYGIGEIVLLKGPRTDGRQIRRTQAGKPALFSPVCMFQGDCKEIQTFSG